MGARLKDALVDRSLTRYPVPIADAVEGLACADSLHEQRDRVVEVFRAVLRTLAGAVLAARVQFGPGPGETSAEVQTLLRQLRRRGLTDGQWVGLLRELLRPWSGEPESYPLPGLVTAFFGRRAPLEATTGPISGHRVRKMGKNRGVDGAGQGRKILI